VTVDRSWVALGDRAIRFARPPVSARALVRAIRAWPGVVDVVVAREHVAAYFADEPAVDPAQLAALATLRDIDEPVREVELRVTYDGPDLDDVARASGLTTAEVVRAHAAATYTVDTLGFAPGFAYLTGLDARLRLPRRATPRPRVPAGSLAIADVYTTVYPFDSPGGWHLIGHVVGVRMFDDHGPRLHLGDQVRFVS
jgi:KipI family sensor histidine kinase inhibitor